MRRRVTTIIVAAVTVLMMFSGTALAHYCTNASKKEGAGNAGVLFADVSEDFEVVPELTTVKMNKQGHVTGGFMDIHVDLNGDRVADFTFNEVFAHAGLPEQALLAAGCGQAVETQVPFFDNACPPE